MLEDLVVGRQHDLDVFKFGIGHQHRLGAQGDIEIRRRPGLLGAVLRRRLRVHAQRPGEDVGHQLAGGDRPVAAHRVEPDPERLIGQQVRILARRQRHESRLGIGGRHLALKFGEATGRPFGEEGRSEVDQWGRVVAGHVLGRGDQVARLQVMATETEDGAGQRGDLRDRPDAGEASGAGRIRRTLEQRGGDQLGQRHLIGTLQDGDGLFAGQCVDQFGLGEGLQQLHRDQADLEPLPTKVGQHGADVLAHRAEGHEDVVRVGHVVAVDRGVAASGQLAVLDHGLPSQPGHLGIEVGAVVDRPGLEVGLVLDRSGQSRVVRVDQRRHQLPGALAPGAQPLTAPLRTEIDRDERLGLLDQGTGVIGLHLIGVLGEPAADVVELGEPELGGVPGDPAVQLPDASLGAVHHLLSDGRAVDASGRIAQVLAQQFGFGEVGLGHHVAGGEAVHGVGDRDQRQRRGAVADRGQVCGLLRIGPEEDGVAGRQQCVDVVVAGHHVQRVFAHHTSGNLQDETAHLLAHGDEVRLHRVQDALAGRGVRDEHAAGQRSAQRAGLRGVLTLGLEEERVFAPDVELALGTGRLIELADLGGRGDRVADDTATDVAHDVGHRGVAVHHAGDSGETRRLDSIKLAVVIG